MFQAIFEISLPRVLLAIELSLHVQQEWTYCRWWVEQHTVVRPRRLLWVCVYLQVFESKLSCNIHRAKATVISQVKNDDYKFVLAT